MADWNSSKITLYGESTHLREVKQFSCDVFFFNTQSWRTLPSCGHYCVPMHTNLFKILCFSCQGKSREIVYQHICLFLWLIFAQHGLFEIQLTVYSARSRLTDLGIYDKSRCGIWLLSIFHIPYIHFQRELRKVTSPKWYLSFLFSIWQYWICNGKEAKHFFFIFYKYVIGQYPIFLFSYLLLISLYTNSTYIIWLKKYSVVFYFLNF